MGSNKLKMISMIFSFLLLSVSCSAQVKSRALLHEGAVPSNGVIDLVANCGAKENGDITQILLKAWGDACACPKASKIVIPAGVYNLGVITMLGPCKAPITFKLDGTVKAPADPKVFKNREWIVFDSVDFLTVTGAGIVDGQGPKAWASSGCEKKSHCSNLPISIRFDNVHHSYVTGITSKDSKNFNVNLCNGDNITFEKFKVTTAAGSMNTDGIHIGKSKNIKIVDTTLECGDDCVSIGDSTSNIEVSKVTCGPGHGISIGSLGKYKNEGPVTGIHVRDCTLTNTDNGARIKAWPGLYPCNVDDIVFDKITMDNVSNPVILDMCYCPHGNCKASEPSLVKMSNVVFKNIKGSAACPEAVQVNCSPGMCKNIELCNINFKYCGPPRKADNFSTSCSNIKPKITPPLNPPGPTCC